MYYVHFFDFEELVNLYVLIYLNVKMIKILPTFMTHMVKAYNWKGEQT